MLRFIIACLAFWMWATTAMAVSINEIRIDQPSTDDDEYFELAGSSGESLDGLTYLVIGDSGANSGIIEAVVDLSGLTVPTSGYFLAAESTFGAPGTIFNGIVPNAVLDMNFENSDNVTHVLVSGFFGANNDDLDTDDNGMLDVLPWGSVIDAIGLVEQPDSNQPGFEWYYGAHLGFSDIGPDGTFVPGHVYRLPDQTGGFAIGQFSLDPMGQITDTPGASNQQVGGLTCDFDNSTTCDGMDIDLLVMEIVAGGSGADFDLNGDGNVNFADVVLWLARAGEANLGPGRSHLIGDANLDGTVDGQDFIAWNTNKFTSLDRWTGGDFNADGTVDGQDFISWNTNKFLSADQTSVPEPGTLSLMFAILCTGISSFRSKQQSIATSRKGTARPGPLPGPASI